MTKKLTKYEKFYIDTVIEHTKQTRDIAKGVTGWGGSREGAGRPSTGRKKQSFYITEEENEQLRKYLEELRNPAE